MTFKIGLPVLTFSLVMLFEASTMEHNRISSEPSLTFTATDLLPDSKKESSLKLLEEVQTGMRLSIEGSSGIKNYRVKEISWGATQTLPNDRTLREYHLDMCDRSVKNALLSTVQGEGEYRLTFALESQPLIYLTAEKLYTPITSYSASIYLTACQ